MKAKPCRYVIVDEQRFAEVITSKEIDVACISL
jgi:hypothetical protein